jgi:hypothetical protein
MLIHTSFDNFQDLSFFFSHIPKRDIMGINDFDYHVLKYFSRVCSHQSLETEFLKFVIILKLIIKQTNTLPIITYKLISKNACLSVHFPLLRMTTSHKPSEPILVKSWYDSSFEIHLGRLNARNRSQLSNTFSSERRLF